MASIVTGNYKEGHKIKLKDPNKLSKLIQNQLTKFNYKHNDKFILYKKTNEYTIIQTSKKIDKEIFVKSIKDDKVLKLIGSVSSIEGMFNHDESIAKGSGGVGFESELEKDLLAFNSGQLLKNTNIIEKLQKITGMKPGGVKVINMGKFNQKRKLKLIDENLIITPMSPIQHGKLVTDITIKVDGKEYYLSLKMSKSYSIINNGFTTFLKNDKDRRNILSSLGVDYKQFEEDFEIYSKSDYSPKIAIETEAKKYLEKILYHAYSSGYIMIHKITDSKNIVEKMKDIPNVQITSSLKYGYRTNLNKYFKIDFLSTVNGHSYKSQLQLRNNAGKVTPNVMLIYQKVI